MTLSDSANSKPERELDLSQPDDVLLYLTDTPYASTRAEALSGGNANFIFRLHLATPLVAAGGAQTVVLKHAKPWIPGDKSFELFIERQSFEATALRHVRAFIPAGAVATVPALFYHDPEAHVLIMEDAGPTARNLKDLLRAGPLSDSASRTLGSALGQFLAAVHVRGSADATLLADVDKNDEGRRITAWITYGRLVDTLKGEGQSAGLIEPPLGLPEADVAEIGRYVDAMVKKVLEARSVFTMGDFWTGNIVVRLDARGEIERIFVIDWEIAKPGLPYLDFGQLVAELNTIGYFAPASGTSVQIALKAYGEAYSQDARVDDEFVRGAAAHVGAHMVTITPAVQNWGSKRMASKVAKDGADYLLRERRGDVEWFKGSVLRGPLTESSI